jgi:glycosyltransferase involved in cell wall biosynthesis
MKKIKILFTIPNFNTAGSGKVLLDIARSLDPNKFEIYICCFHTKGKFYEVVNNSGIKIFIFRFSENFEFSLDYLVKIKKIISFFKKNNFDIIHSWHWSSDFSEPLAAKIAGAKWIYTKKAMSWGNKSWKIKSYLADKIITINDEMGPAFFPGSKKVKLIPIGIDIQHYAPIPKEGSLMDKLKLSEKDFIVISVANMVPVKGIELLIEAVKYIKEIIPNFKLVLVGDDNNEYGQQLKHQVKESDLSELVIFVGKVLDVRPYHSISDLFVIPSKDKGRKEGMPMAPVEAMAAEKLVIGSKISGINYILKDFPELLFSPGSVQAISEKILWVYNLSFQEKEQIKKKLRFKVVEEYNMEKFIARHEELYLDLVS